MCHGVGAAIGLSWSEPSNKPPRDLKNATKECRGQKNRKAVSPPANSERSRCHILN